MKYLDSQCHDAIRDAAPSGFTPASHIRLTRCHLYGPRRAGYAAHTSLDLDHVPLSWQRTPRHAAHTSFERSHGRAQESQSARLNGFTRGGQSHALRGGIQRGELRIRLQAA